MGSKETRGKPSGAKPDDAEAKKAGRSAVLLAALLFGVPLVLLIAVTLLSDAFGQ